MERVWWLQMSLSPLGGANSAPQITLLDLRAHFEARGEGKVKEGKGQKG